MWFVDGDQSSDDELTGVLRVGELGSCRCSARFMSSHKKAVIVGSCTFHDRT
jgi:hypothetical protein